MLFLCYPKCSTCKKAQTWLEDHGLDYQLRDIKTQNPTQEEQLALLASDGMLVKRPILLDGDKVLVGFRQGEWEAALL